MRQSMCERENPSIRRVWCTHGDQRKRTAGLEKANRTKRNGTRCTVKLGAASRWLSRISLHERALTNRVGGDTPWRGGAIERTKTTSKSVGDRAGSNESDRVRRVLCMDDIHN